MSSTDRSGRHNLPLFDVASNDGSAERPERSLSRGRARSRSRSRGRVSLRSASSRGRSLSRSPSPVPSDHGDAAERHVQWDESQARREFDPRLQRSLNSYSEYRLHRDLRPHRYQNLTGKHGDRDWVKTVERILEVSKTHRLADDQLREFYFLMASSRQHAEVVLDLMREDLELRDESLRSGLSLPQRLIFLQAVKIHSVFRVGAIDYAPDYMVSHLIRISAGFGIDALTTDDEADARLFLRSHGYFLDLWSDEMFALFHQIAADPNYADLFETSFWGDRVEPLSSEPSLAVYCTHATSNGRRRVHSNLREGSRRKSAVGIGGSQAGGRKMTILEKAKEILNILRT
ncbi:hypothetical protein BT63DRAFT_473220 [Microthyrium microscopicum]|uniref:Uncharacterized protein n=1 Tax=Microthyrium microscopicum TaxID=703497 RepID=A0A6A6U3L3_9PEZI|nr:hypothetical protein BT63DRAFT_473220 [Microthyrium microscopicum]